MKGRYQETEYIDFDVARDNPARLIHWWRLLRDDQHAFKDIWVYRARFEGPRLRLGVFEFQEGEEEKEKASQLGIRLPLPYCQQLKCEIELEE